jgi:hypothetical protein
VFSGGLPRRRDESEHPKSGRGTQARHGRTPTVPQPLALCRPAVYLHRRRRADPSIPRDRCVQHNRRPARRRAEPVHRPARPPSRARNSTRTHHVIPVSAREVAAPPVIAVALADPAEPPAARRPTAAQRVSDRRCGNQCQVSPNAARAKRRRVCDLVPPHTPSWISRRKDYSRHSSRADRQLWLGDLYLADGDRGCVTPCFVGRGRKVA